MTGLKAGVRGSPAPAGEKNGATPRADAPSDPAKFADSFPFELTRADLDRGQERVHDLLRRLPRPARHRQGQDPGARLRASRRTSTPIRPAGSRSTERRAAARRAGGLSVRGGDAAGTGRCRGTARRFRRRIAGGSPPMSAPCELSQHADLNELPPSERTAAQNRSRRCAVSPATEIGGRGSELGPTRTAGHSSRRWPARSCSLRWGFTPLAGPYALSQAAISYSVAFHFWLGVPARLPGGADDPVPDGRGLGRALAAGPRNRGANAACCSRSCSSRSPRMLFMGQYSPYPWARPLESVATGEVLDELRDKTRLLNPPLVIVRAVDLLRALDRLELLPPCLVGAVARRRCGGRRTACPCSAAPAW